MIKILHNNDCSKSRAILELLDESHIPFEVRDIVAQPLSEEEVRLVVKKLGIKPEKLVRTNEAIYKEQYENKVMEEDDIVKMLSQHPELVQRPIIIKGSMAVIGRPLENVNLFLSK